MGDLLPDATFLRLSNSSPSPPCRPKNRLLPALQGRLREWSICAIYVRVALTEYTRVLSLTPPRAWQMNWTHITFLWLWKKAMLSAGSAATMLSFIQSLMKKTAPQYGSFLFPLNPHLSSHSLFLDSNWDCHMLVTSFISSNAIRYRITKGMRELLMVKERKKVEAAAIESYIKW